LNLLFTRVPLDSRWRVAFNLILGWRWAIQVIRMGIIPSSIPSRVTVMEAGALPDTGVFSEVVSIDMLETEEKGLCPI